MTDIDAALAEALEVLEALYAAVLPFAIQRELLREDEQDRMQRDLQVPFAKAAGIVNDRRHRRQYATGLRDMRDHYDREAQAIEGGEKPVPQQSGKTTTFGKAMPSAAQPEPTEIAAKEFDEYEEARTAGLAVDVQVGELDYAGERIEVPATGAVGMRSHWQPRVGMPVAAVLPDTTSPRPGVVWSTVGLGGGKATVLVFSPNGTGRLWTLPHRDSVLAVPEGACWWAA